jgi:pyrroloquinoline-quinone synthase
MTTVANLDRLIRERHLLKHPFYVAWSKGEVPESTLRNYAGQYYQFESNFPRYVAATYSRLEDPASRRVLLENLIDEEGRSPTHPELWVDFGRGLGMSARAVRGMAPTSATRALLRTYERHTLRGSAATGLGALYAYESIFPEVAAEKSRGLREHYGIKDAASHEFFRVHTEADRAHAAAERRLLVQEIAHARKAGQQAEVGVRDAISSWWGFLDSFPCF